MPTLIEALEGNFALPREITKAMELSERPPSRYKVQQLSEYRDRVLSGLPPMFDYYVADGAFFKYPKTRDEIDNHEAHFVNWDTIDGR